MPNLLIKIICGTLKEYESMQVIPGSIEVVRKSSYQFLHESFPHFLERMQDNIPITIFHPFEQVNLSISCLPPADFL